MKRLKMIVPFFMSITLFMGLFISSCKKSDSSLPPVNGYNGSNDVASTNLLAHWTFDGTNNETISGTAPKSSAGASFITGVKGQALSLNSGYLLYPTIAALSGTNAIPSVTVSAWINTDNNGTTVSEVFALTQPVAAQTDWNVGPVNMYVETSHPTTTDDTLALHSAISTYISGTRYGGDNINDYGVRGTDFQTVHGTNKWVHYVMRYDASGSNIDIYANGVRVSNNNYRTRSYGTPAVRLGAISIPAATMALIGGWPNAATGFTNSSTQTWQGLFKGSIDELRVYNKALSDLEIGSLYQLELAGR